MNELKNNSEYHDYSLKDQLLSGQITAEQFLDAIMERDQSTPERADAFENIKLLEDEGVKAVILKYSEVERQYNNLLSLSYFHVGQITGIKNDNSVALENFKKALEAANKISDPNYKYWQLYVQGTVSYFEKDIQSVKGAYNQLDDGRNKEIIGNMITALNESEIVDYSKVY